MSIPEIEINVKFLNDEERVNQAAKIMANSFIRSIREELMGKADSDGSMNYDYQNNISEA